MALDVRDIPNLNRGIDQVISRPDTPSVARVLPDHLFLISIPGRCAASLASWFRVALLISCLFQAGLLSAQTTQPSPQTTEAARIDRLEQMLNSVLESNRHLSEEVRELRRITSNSDAPSLQAKSVPQSTVPEPSPSDEQSFYGSNGELLTAPRDSVSQSSSWPAIPPSQPNAMDGLQVTYDNGFVIAPRNVDDNPFTLKINSQNMFRYSGFAPGADYWTDSSGAQTPINDNSNFEIPRGRLIFSGKVFDPKLSYLLNIDYNTVNSNPIGFRAYELSYRFNQAVDLHIGQGKVPGSREWLESGFAALEGPDRSMATTFFRPSLSQGLWLIGQPIDGLHYHTMLSNGFNTINLSPNQFNHQFCWAASTWWEPWGDFGKGYADLEDHAEPVARLGASYSIALGHGSQAQSNGVENSSIRLSDGTLITQTGAFAPGVTLQSYDISLLAIDYAFKFRGLSFSTEWYTQDLYSLVGNGPLPISSTRAYGGVVQGGYFVVPQTLELYSRASFVSGAYGSGSETAGGLNWFLIPGKSNLRFTFDTAWLDSSPADQNRTGYSAGQTGLLVRTQITATY